MSKKFPIESEGLEPIIKSIMGKRIAIGVVRGVNDAESELVEGFEITIYELKILAQHYMEEIGNIEFSWEALGQSGSYGIRFRPFANNRLAKIRSLLGKDDFELTINPITKKFDETLAEVHEQVNNPLPCSICASPRCGPLPLDMYEGLCNKCVVDNADYT